MSDFLANITSILSAPPAAASAAGPFFFSFCQFGSSTLFSAASFSRPLRKVNEPGEEGGGITLKTHVELGERERRQRTERQEQHGRRQQGGMYVPTDGGHDGGGGLQRGNHHI